jgi:hypothetical protein
LEIIMRKRLASIASLFAVLMFPSIVLATPFYIGNSPLVPPLDGVYRTPQDVHATYSGPGLLVVLENISHFGFSNVGRVFGGGGVTETFDSVATGSASLNGGLPFAVTLTGPVTVFMSNYNSLGQTGTFATEMLQLDLSGGGVRIRESPILQSVGQTIIQDIGGGAFRIDSFFDIFTELSLDGGQTWIPSQGSTHVDLTNTPLPATWVAFVSGLGLLGFVYHRRKQVAV